MANRNERFDFRSLAIRRAERVSSILRVFLSNGWEEREIHGAGQFKIRMSGLLTIARAMKTDLETEGLGEKANQLFPSIPSRAPNPVNAVPNSPSRELSLPTDPATLERYREHLVGRSLRLGLMLRQFNGEKVITKDNGTTIQLAGIQNMALAAFQDMKAAGLEEEAKIIFEAKPAPDSD